LILGSAKSVPLSLAKQNASKLEARVRLGEDPALDRQTAKLEVDNTFGVLAHQYLETRKSEWRPVTYKEVERHLKKYAKSLHRLPISAVSQHNIASLLNTLAKDVGNVTANRVRGSLCSLFGWVIREGVRLPEGNVASYTNKRQERARDRVLSDGELRAIWTACPDDDYGAILKLLMLTAQRANEIAELRWDEVHDEQIVLPAERTKNKRPQIIPLSEPAKAILGGFERGDRTLEYFADELGGGEDDDRTDLLRGLASCFDPNSKHKRLAEVRNRGKDVETDEHRDESVAWLVWKLEKTRGRKRAVAEVAALIGRSGKAVREARKRVARRYKERGLRDLEKVHT
jgi:integrase